MHDRLEAPVSQPRSGHVRRSIQDSRAPSLSPDDVGLRNAAKPVLMMNLPLSLSADVPNNALMQKLSAAERRIDRPKALAQFHTLYRFLSARAFVYLLPSRPGLQDLPYVGNIGVVLPHCAEETVVVSRFKSAPRVGEADVALAFFRQMQFQVHCPPERLGKSQPIYFEGEADLKHLRENLYVGAHGLRTSRPALRWFERSFDMRVIDFPMTDDHLYHLDCCILVLNPDTIVLSRRRTEARALRAIEKECAVEFVTRENVRSGLTNSVILGKHLLCDSPISGISRTHPYYASERRKIARLEAIGAKYGLEPRVFNLSEFNKSGAALSCLVMHLN
jgi:N-dimethylarginine dimethylaminohydrolase